ncbi:MAG: hypothetical protein IK122_00815 [Alphaproteobacteria bacterium]|nr:hypothetical protein [Alphaproteobacteria bacterium]MBR6502591.1 hypothetical protein [Clostridia bacterium]
MRTEIKTFGDFTLYKEEFTNTNEIKCEDLIVKSAGKAEKHVIEIRLNGSLYLDPNDKTRGKYKYSSVYVSHGMRCVIDSLSETKEYIDTLTEALNVAFEVEKYCILNGLWTK